MRRYRAYLDALLDEAKQHIGLTVSLYRDEVVNLFDHDDYGGVSLVLEGGRAVRLDRAVLALEGGMPALATRLLARGLARRPPASLASSAAETGPLDDDEGIPSLRIFQLGSIHAAPWREPLGFPLLRSLAEGLACTLIDTACGSSPLQTTQRHLGQPSSARRFGKSA
jgi:hypothetical protein